MQRGDRFFSSRTFSRRSRRNFDAAVSGRSDERRADQLNAMDTVQIGTISGNQSKGLTADQLRAAVEASVPAANRRAVGPTVDQVTLADGTRVWRVRVPGAFPARAARVEVQVGGRRVGEGVLAPDLQSITAVTTDGSGLTAGRPVTFRWEGGPLEAAGPLELAR